MSSDEKRSVSSSSRARALAAILASALLTIGIASLSSAAEIPNGAPKRDLSETFGVDVGDRDDPVAKMLQLGSGLRVMKVEPGSIGSKIAYPGVRRNLERGDFVLRVRVKGVDAEDKGPAMIATPDDFLRACRRARRVIWEQPFHRGTLLFDVFTQAGYNMDDWKQITLETALDLSGGAEPPVEPTPPAPKQSGGST